MYKFVLVVMELHAPFEQSARCHQREAVAGTNWLSSIVDTSENGNPALKCCTTKNGGAGGCLCS